MSEDVYQIVTQRIINQLREGVIPWTKSWDGYSAGAFNRISKKSYSILNQMLLSHRGEYATYRQWKKLGGKLKKDAIAEIVVFWKIFEKKEVRADGTQHIETIPVLRYYRVFHISCIEGVKPLAERRLRSIAPIDNAERILTDYLGREHIKIYWELDDKALYSLQDDVIRLPLIGQFQDAVGYYSTVFHEVVHSTGHKDRLNRFKTCERYVFGEEGYSKEELVAEIGSAMLLNKIGIDTKNSIRNSAAYIQSWLTALENDTRLIVSAGGKAETAVRFILGEFVTKQEDT